MGECLSIQGKTVSIQRKTVSIQRKTRHSIYTVIKNIKGKGKIVQVDEVQSETDQQHYARKILYLYASGMDDEFKKKVLDESRERQALAHPCIQQIKEVYNDKNEYGDDYHYVVSRLATSGTLEEAIAQRRKENKPMTEQELMNQFSMILLAME